MSRDIKQHLTQDEFIGFIREDLPEEVAEEIDRHLEYCVACTKKLEDFYTAQEDFPSEQWAAEREAFISRLRQNIFQEDMMGVEYKRDAVTLVIILQFIHKKLRWRWRMVHHNGKVVPRHVPAGAAQQGGLQKVQTLKKEFKDCFVEVDIYGDPEGRACLQLEVKDASGGNLTPQVQVILKDGRGEEISSKVSQDGPVSLEGLTQDKYSIEIVKDKRVIGNISLDLRR